MTGSSIAGIITACATVLLAVGGVLTAISVLLPILRGTRDNAAALAANSTALGEVHEIVNQRYTDLNNYLRAVIRALEDAGVPVPVDQSLPPVDNVGKLP
jgi:hypothetical protein